MKKAFTLVEMVIVVSILGILAAAVLPSVQAQTTRARDAAAMSALKTFRNQIELYKFQHKDVLPGYRGIYPTTVTELALQFTNCTKKDGSPSPFMTPTGDYVYGPYISKIPVNPYNGLQGFKIVPESTEFSTAADDSTGWLYKRETGEVRVNSTGTTTDGVKHYDL